MAEITCLKMKEITDKEHLKKFKPAILKTVIEIFNKNWFDEPVSSSGKPAIAKAIAEVAIEDFEFRNKHFEQHENANFETLDDQITVNTAVNDRIDPALPDDEYDALYKDVPMITPADVENGTKNGLTDEILDVIKELTGLDYLEMYGFGLEEKEEITEEKETVVEKEEIKEEVLPEEIVEEKKEPEKQPVVDKKEVEKDLPKPNPGEMGVHTVDLCEALEFVNPGLGKEENEDLVLFDKEFVRTCSSNISVIHPFVSGIKGCVSGKDLVALAKKLPQQDLNLSQSDSKLFIKGQQSDIEFNFSTLMMPTCEAPGEEAVWLKLPKNFSEMVAVASLSCSSKSQNPIYNCVVVEKDTVVACENGHRGVEVIMESAFDGVLNIKGDRAKELIKYLPYEVCIEGNSWFHFKNAYGTIVSLRQYATGEFSQAFYDNLGHKGIEIDIPNGTKKLVERSSILAGKGFRDYVTVNVSGNNMVITGRSETGCLTETIKLKDNEADVEFAIHPKLFKEVLELADYLEVCENYVLFKGPGICCWISKVVPNN